MRRSIIFLALVVFSAACLSEDGAVFIPLSPMTEIEIEQAKEQFRSDPEMADFDVDDVFGDGTDIYTYRESDIRLALAGIEDSDERLSLCSNTIAGGATRIVYLSSVRGHDVIVKSASCKQAEGGLSCNPVEANSKQFYREPKNYFSVEGEVTYDEASLLLSIYEKYGIADLPKWYQGFTVSSVNTISKVPGGYKLSLGEIYCGGCKATFVVRLEEAGNEQRLILVNEPEGVCI
ncbi:MAG: hypothetical protein DRR42_22915 [Gammaproteobacteria bacterium]|nr:MAG: hypothetical protein DRR42_22915 [Gammaproteobacteria bacterium]